MISLKIIISLGFLAAVSAEYNHFGEGSNFGAYSYNGGPRIPILRYENVNDGFGNYRYSYETGNGISAHESGSPRAGGAVGAEGGFSYRAPDGRTLAVAYTADERGFRPVGAHLPTPPPVPAAILRSLEYNRQHPEEDDSGRYKYNSNGRYY